MYKHLLQKVLAMKWYSVRLFLLLLLLFNHIPIGGGGGGGYFGPCCPKAVSQFRFNDMSHHNSWLCHFNICLVTLKLFVKKEIWNFKKMKKENLSFQHHIALWKKISKNGGVLPKIHTFPDWIWIKYVLSSLLSYIT